MQQNEPDGSGTMTLESETVEQSIIELRISLTAAFAHAQLLQRRLRQGAPSTPQQVDRAAGVIASSCTDMMQTLIDLEDACRRT